MLAVTRGLRKWTASSREGREGWEGGSEGVVTSMWQVWRPGMPRATCLGGGSVGWKVGCGGGEETFGEELMKDQSDGRETLKGRLPAI